MTSFKFDVVPDVRVVQVVALLEVKIVPPFPATTKAEPYTADWRSLVVPDVRVVHTVELVDVKIVPYQPVTI